MALLPWQAPERAQHFSIQRSQERVGDGSHRDTPKGVLEIGIFGEQPLVFHALAHPSGHVTPIGLSSPCSPVHVDGWRRIGTISSGIHTAIPQSIIILFPGADVYIHGF